MGYLLRPLMLLALSSLIASAAEIHIPADQPDLQSAFAVATSGDSILLAPGTYTGVSNRDLDLAGRELSVIGTGGSAVTALDLEGAGQAFVSPYPGAPGFLLQGLTIRNGSATRGGGIEMRSTPAQCRDLIFIECTAILEGGAIYAKTYDLECENVHILDCAAGGTGGGLYIGFGSLQFLDGLVTGCSSTDGGGALALGSSGSAVATVRTSTIAYNDCGGLHIFGWFELSNCVVAYNGGPGIDSSGYSFVDIRRLCIWGNAGGDFAGPLFKEPGRYWGQLEYLDLDPLFCDGNGGDFSVAANSPCLADSPLNPWSQALGLFGEGCGAQPVYGLTGVIRDQADQPVAGAEIVTDIATVTSSSEGIWALSVPAGWSGTIAPNLVTHDFSPLSYDLVDVQADQIGLDFLAHDPHVHEVPGEFPSIASALVVCTDGDTILLAAGSYSGPENTDINFGGLDLALIGAGAEATVIDASDEPGDPVCIRLENDETRATLIQGLTLRGSSGGCLYSVSGTASPTVRDCIIEEGGLHVGYSTTSAVSFHGGAPLFENCLFQRNRGSAVGCSQGTQAEFLDCRFESNTSSSGAAVKVSNSEASFTRCEFRENRADAVFLQEETGWAGRGGAVCVWGSESPGSTVFEDCLFAGNVAKSYTDQYDPPLQSGAGGALYVRDASVSLLRCTIVDNEAEMIAGEEILGGGLFAMDASVTLDQCIVALNRGGGLYASNAASDPSLACSDVWANENGDFLGGASDPTGQDGNISLDPYFCEVVADDFTLESNSPCLPPHNDCGLQMGAFGLGCTNTASESVPANLTLHLRAHPNPFNPVTTIAFAPLASGPVTLTVHDIAGRHVATLLDGEPREAGQNEFVWDAAGLGSGIYLILLDAGDQWRSHKVVLIK